MGSKNDENKLTLMVGLLREAMHDMVHAEVHRQVGELRTQVNEVAETTMQNAKRISTTEDDMDSAEGNMMNLMEMTSKAVESIRADLHSAVVEMNNPDDERQAKNEKRTNRLEEQMTQLIELLGQAANLE